MPTRIGLRLAATLAVTVLLGACTGGDRSPSAPASPSGTATPDALAVYRAIAADVAGIRELDPPERADPRIIDAEQLRANLEAEFDETNPPERILVAERIDKALGLLPADASLRALSLDFQGSQVIGYYDPSVDELFLVSRSGSLGPTERATYAHEFTHQLQDRHFDLESLGLEDATDEGDRALAVLGLVEGDAVSVQTSWMTASLGATELAEIVAAAADPEALAVIGRTPAILLEAAMFPYQTGAAFVSELLAGRGYGAVDAAYARPPASTEQVLHPAKYRSGERPLDVMVPADLATRFGSGWRLDAQDTLGELQLRVWLREGGVAGDVARVAAEGWGGDRLGLLAAPAGDGDLVVLVTEWDTTADAREFREAATAAVAGYGPTGSVVAAGRRVVVGIGSAEPARARFAAILEALAAD